MIIRSTLSPKEYISAMKDNMSGHFELGQERFTGYFLGRLFYVTYHSGYEYDRRLNNPKNAALGYVKGTSIGCDVRFLTFRGALCPLVFLPLLLCMLACSIVIGAPDNIQMSSVIALIVTVLYAPVEALIEFMNERAEDGHKTLLSMLLDPTDPLSNYNNV